MHPILEVRTLGEEYGDVEGAREELATAHAQQAGVAMLLVDAAPPDTLLGCSVPHVLGQRSLLAVQQAACSSLVGRKGEERYPQCRREGNVRAL